MKYFFLLGVLLSFGILFSCSGDGVAHSSHQKVTKLHSGTLKVREEYFVKDSVRDSLYQSWYRNGMKADSGYFRQGKKEGTWYLFDSISDPEKWSWVDIKIFEYENGILIRETELHQAGKKPNLYPHGISAKYIKFYDSDTLKIDSVWDENGILNNNRIEYSDERPDTFFTYESPGKYHYVDVYKGFKSLKKIVYYPDFSVDTFINFRRVRIE